MPTITAPHEQPSGPLRTAWRMYQRSGATITGLFLTIMVPLYGIAFLIPSLRLTYFRHVVHQPWYVILVDTLVFPLIASLATMAVVYFTANAIDGQPVSYPLALKKSWEHFRAAIKTKLLAFFLIEAFVLASFVALTVILFIMALFAHSKLTLLPPQTIAAITYGYALIILIPLFVIYIFWIFSLPAVVLRNMSGKKALDYSKNIVKGSWWTVTSYTVGYFAVAIGIMFALRPAADALQFDYGINLLTETLINIVLSFFVTVMTALFLTLEKKST